LLTKVQQIKVAFSHASTTNFEANFRIFIFREKEEKEEKKQVRIFFLSLLNYITLLSDEKGNFSLNGNCKFSYQVFRYKGKKFYKYFRYVIRSGPH